MTDDVEVLQAFEGLIELCNHGDFKNGVTDSTGSIDEGDVRAGEYIHRARMALAALRSITETNRVQREALALALQWLGELEPPDSRAVSNEFVAMACVLCGKADQACMDIIRAATKPPLAITAAVDLAPSEVKG